MILGLGLSIGSISNDTGEMPALPPGIIWFNDMELLFNGDYITFN